MKNEPTLKALEAAQYLCEALGGQLQHWENWLKNDRRSDRIGKIPTAPLPGRPRYMRPDLDEFIDGERGSRLRETGGAGRLSEVISALGLDSIDGSRYGRRLEITVRGQLMDSDTRAPFVQVVIASPLLVYCLSPNQAKEIAEQLLAEADQANHLARIASGQE